MHMKAKNNQYAKALGPLLDKTPKAVFAAVAVSLLTQGGDNWELLGGRLLQEWATLHENGIVPQKPPLSYRHTWDEDKTEGTVWDDVLESEAARLEGAGQ